MAAGALWDRHLRERAGGARVQREGAGDALGGAASRRDAPAGSRPRAASPTRACARPLPRAARAARRGRRPGRRGARRPGMPARARARWRAGTWRRAPRARRASAPARGAGRSRARSTTPPTSGTAIVHGGGRKRWNGRTSSARARDARAGTRAENRTGARASVPAAQSRPPARATVRAARDAAAARPRAARRPADQHQRLAPATASARASSSATIAPIDRPTTCAWSSSAVVEHARHVGGQHRHRHRRRPVRRAPRPAVVVARSRAVRQVEVRDRLEDRRGDRPAGDHAARARPRRDRSGTSWGSAASARRSSGCASAAAIAAVGLAVGDQADVAAGDLDVVGLVDDRALPAHDAVAARVDARQPHLRRRERRVVVLHEARTRSASGSSRVASAAGQRRAPGGRGRPPRGSAG